MPTATQTPHDLDLETLDDSQLLRRYVDHRDERAFSILFARWNDRVVNFVFGRIGDRDTAEEIVQDSWTQVHRHAHRFQWEKKFSTWIYTIAGNLAKNVLRSHSRNRETLFRTLEAKWLPDEADRPLQWADTSYAPDKEAQRRQLREDVEAAVADLKPKWRIVFVLREFEGKSYAEISEITGMPTGTVKSRLSRARSAFAETIRGSLAKADLDQLEVPDVEPPSDEPVDLNTADTEELCTLPEIGPVGAKKIIEARPFSDVEELEVLEWLGTGRMERIRPHVRVSSAEERVAA